MKRELFIATICFVLIGFFIITKLVLEKVHLTSPVVIDEEFHIPQGIAYCNFKFDTWDSKITTLPGLYLISALIMGPLHFCSAYWLRMVNVIASVLNMYLFYLYINRNNNKQNSWTNLLSSLNLSILPPLYFFSFVYYTDVLSVTFILFLLIFNQRDNHIAASISGMVAVLIRQTNIIWVIMVLGQYFITETLKQGKPHKHQDYTTCEILAAIWEFKNGKVLKRLKLKVWINVLLYFVILSSFGLFVIINGGITVGDKSAHVATLHLPQMFYFSLFCIIFGWPHLFENIPLFLNHINRNKFLTLVCMAIFATIVHFNTLEHPYLLADNRHYTFYIWNRFYRRYDWFRYAMMPVYYFGLFTLLSHMKRCCSTLYELTYFCSVFAILVLQRMIEIRYFFIPFILFRINVKNTLWCQLLAEFVFYLVVNIVTLDIFFTKDIRWADFDYVQRLIW